MTERPINFNGPMDEWTDLDYIVEMLNRKPQGGTSPYAEELIRLMERLRGCGGNLKKMMDGDPELARVVTEVCGTRWMPSETGGAQWARVEGISNRGNTMSTLTGKQQEVQA